jgi:hypothetical protein
VERVAGTGTLSSYEKRALESMLPELEASIKKGINFLHS